MGKPLLHINDLNIHFNTEAGDFHALKNASFTVNRGEIVAVVGESGSGKSITALSVLKLLPGSAKYSSGTIQFSEDGIHQQDMLHCNDNTLRQVRGNRISMIFQEPMTSLNPLMTCGKQVTESIRLHQSVSGKDARDKTLGLFEKVQLPDAAGMLERYPHQLSGGQKQRVMIAMAMSCKPSLLIADEPTTALDVTVQKTILQLIRKLQQEEDMGVIFITHDLGLVAEIADRVVVMLKGEIVEEGKVNDILNYPKHPYTKALLECRPALHAKGSRLPVVSDFMNAENIPTVTNSPVTVPNYNSPPLVEVRELEVWFPRQKNFLGKALNYTKAVDDVSFDIYERETLGLVGESGCGKTTLGRALLRLVKPHAGSVKYKGKDFLSMDEKALKPLRKDMQIIFQDPYSSLNPRMSVGNAIEEAMLVHSLGDKRSVRRGKTVELLEKVGLQADHYYRYPHEFSGGQRQRIGIARALSLDPAFLVCDESVSALDVSVQAQVLNLLNDLKKEYGFTVLFISHDLSVVHFISDRIMVMNKGRIEESGPSSEVFNNPKSDYTRRLISAIPGRKWG